MSTRPAIAAALALLAAGCGSTKPDPTPTALFIAGPSTSILFGLGKTFQLIATERLPDRSQVAVTNKATWASSNPAVLTVSSSGLLTTTGVGITAISASYQSLSATTNVSVQLPVLTVLGVIAPSVFTAAGQTKQLTAKATFNDGSTQDVTSSAQWSSGASSVIDVTAEGLATSSALGVGTISASYANHIAGVALTVTPPGTFATTGRVRLPGAGNSGDELGVPDFTVTNSVTGVALQSDARGYYNLGGLTSGTHLLFTKSDFEPAEIVPASTSTFSEVVVQRVFRITAGDTTTSTIRENDIVYDPSPTFHCAVCRLIRVVNPANGTLNARVTWTETHSTLTIWANGTVIGPTNSGLLAGDIPVTAGELLLYIRSTGGWNTPMTLTTAFNSPAPYFFFVTTQRGAPSASTR
jgi:hypothetical protein